ncbi:MAG: hypothetical protein ACJ72Z_01775 [Pyrinomonadaceae bacterium]
MGKNKTTSIRTETSELWIISRTGSPRNPAWCERCAAEVRWLTFGDAAKVNEISVGKLSLLMDAGKVHTSEMPEGHILFCLNSFSTLMSEQKLLVKGNENENTNS